MLGKQLRLWFNTLKYYGFHHLTRWVWREARLRLLPVPEIPASVNIEGNIDFAVPPCRYEAWNSADEISRGNFRFLNQLRELGCPPEWDPEEVPLLWKFHLHSFGYLSILDASVIKDLCSSWVSEVPGGRLPAWHPHPTSLRIRNWVMWGPSDNSRILKSLYRQSRHLARHVEYHRPGNHLVDNGRALFLAGEFFSQDRQARRWRRQGLKILQRAAEEQVLPDGGHFERSPMYHSLVLEAFLDVLNVLPNENTAYGELKKVAIALANCLASVTHPDGTIPLFNDSTTEVAPSPDLLLGYGECITGKKARFRSSFPETGWYPAKGNSLFVVIDGGKPGSDAVPGHVHADLFTYEVSFNNQKVLTDTGVFGYSSGDRRNYDRSTKAHNTVTVDNTSQAEAWGSFRLGRRSGPQYSDWTRLSDGSFKFAGRFCGYSELIGDNIIHDRTIKIDSNISCLVVTDVVDGGGQHTVRSYLHLHPDINVTDKGNHLQLAWLGNNKACIIPSAGVLITIAETPYSPEFGVSRRRSSVVLTSLGSLPTRLSYRIQFLSIGSRGQTVR
jgi:uncharacterized heparinase superfamily protein